MNEEKEKIDTKKQRKYESHHSPKKNGIWYEYQVD